MVKFVSPRGALPRIFGLPPELQCFGPPEGGRCPDLLFFVAVEPFNTAFLDFKAFDLASSLGGAGASFFAFGAIFRFYYF